MFKRLSLNFYFLIFIMQILKPDSFYPFQINQWPPKNIPKDTPLFVVDIKDNFSWLYSGGYWFFEERTDKKEFFLGHLKKMNEYDKKQAALFHHYLALDVEVESYKIHLMPKKEDLLFTINKLLNSTKTYPELLKLIYKFKVKNDINKIIHPITEEAMPIIVIYPSEGKKNAQEVLNNIYEIFKNQEGLNITPRWNEKITSLIYVAQSGGDFKKQEKYKNLFESGDDKGNGRVYFKADVTGIIKDYHLINPKEKELAKEKADKEKIDKLKKLKANQTLKAKQFKSTTDVLSKQANILQQFKLAQQNKNTKKIKQLRPQIIKIKKDLIKIPLNVKNAQGQTPLMLNPRIAYIVYGVPKNRAKNTVNAKDINGKTVLQYLITSPFVGNINLYRSLIDGGAKVTDNDIKSVRVRLKTKPNQLKPIVLMLQQGKKLNK